MPTLAVFQLYRGV